MKLPLQQRKERLYEGQEILARMSEEEKVDLYNKLRYYTKACFRRLNKDEIHKFVVESILAVSENRWAYPPLDEMGNAKDISFDKFLFGVIRNKVSHHNRSKRRKVECDQHDESQSYEDWFDQIQYKQARHRGCDMSNPETDAIRKELREHMRALVSSDKGLSKIVELLFADLKPREIAEELKLPRHAVYNALRRLRRIVTHAPGKEGNNGKANQKQKTKQPLRWRQNRRR